MITYNKKDIPDHLQKYFKPAELGLERTPEEYVAKLVEIFGEVKRVLRPDGSLWLNLGDSYAGGGRGGSRLDHPEWCSKKQGTNKGCLGMPKSNDVAGIKPKDLVGIPWRVAFALQADGWYLRSDIIWHKPNPMPESVTDRPTKSHEYIFLLSKNAKYYFDQDAVREENQTKYTESWGNFKRNKVVGKMADLPMDKKDFDKYRTNGRNIRDVWTQNNYHIADIFAEELRCYGIGEDIISQCLFNTFVQCSSVWTIPTQPYKEAHFAVFPRELAERCIKAGCPENGTVLDPFAGSGTTGEVARNLGRDFILIELNPKYINLQEKRSVDLFCQPNIGGQP